MGFDPHFAHAPSLVVTFVLGRSPGSTMRRPLSSHGRDNIAVSKQFQAHDGRVIQSDQTIPRDKRL
jgi:hypothetical protein